jgi:hypothetical protein
VGEVSVGEVQFQPLEPATGARFADATKASWMRWMSSTVTARGTIGRFPPKATADGAMVSQPPSPESMR